MYGEEKEAFDVTEPCLTLKRRGNTGSVFRQLYSKQTFKFLLIVVLNTKTHKTGWH